MNIFIIFSAFDIKKNNKALCFACPAFCTNSHHISPIALLRILNVKFNWVTYNQPLDLSVHTNFLDISNSLIRETPQPTELCRYAHTDNKKKKKKMGQYGTNNGLLKYVKIVMIKSRESHEKVMRK